MENLLGELKFTDGLIPAVIVEEDGQVLTLCYLNKDAIRRTLQTRRVHVFRRSAGRLMMKGESSGHVQEVVELRVDCEGKSLVIVVRQKVAACHAGYRTCYYRRYRPEDDRWEICEEKVFEPGDVYGS